MICPRLELQPGFWTAWPLSDSWDSLSFFVLFLPTCLDLPVYIRPYRCSVLWLAFASWFTIINNVDVEEDRSDALFAHNIPFRHQQWRSRCRIAFPGRKESWSAGPRLSCLSRISQVLKLGQYKSCLYSEALFPPRSWCMFWTLPEPVSAARTNSSSEWVPGVIIWARHHAILSKTHLLELFLDICELHDVQIGDTDRLRLSLRHDG